MNKRYFKGLEVTEEVWQHIRNLEARNHALVAVLELIAAPMRPDGSYNRDRKACELLAKEVLNPKTPEGRVSNEGSEQKCLTN